MELMEVYHEAMAKWIIARATSGKCEGSEFVFDLIESAIRKEATKFFSHRSKNQTWSGWISVDHIVTIGSPKLPGLSLRIWPSILSSLVMSLLKKHAPKDYSVDQTKGSIISNSVKYAYLTASRLLSSTSNRYARPRPENGKIDASSSAVEDVSYSRRLRVVSPKRSSEKGPRRSQPNRNRI